MGNKQLQKNRKHRKGNAINIQNNLRKIVEELFLDNDFLFFLVQGLPFKDLRYPIEINGNVLDTYHRCMEVVTLVSLLLPCIVALWLKLTRSPNRYSNHWPTFFRYRDIELAQTYSKTTDKDKINPIT